jgi:hypothetical protein
MHKTLPIGEYIMADRHTETGLIIEQSLIGVLVGVFGTQDSGDRTEMTIFWKDSGIDCVFKVRCRGRNISTLRSLTTA